MGYYIRVLSTSPKCIPFSVMQTALEKTKFTASLALEDGTSDDWLQVMVGHNNGDDIACIERNLVEEDSLASEELAEFAEEVASCNPASAAEWLTSYFQRVRCIYAFQVLHGAHRDDGWDVIGAIKTAIWSHAPSIFQADQEGFTNEDGYHILWQFDDSVEGNWWMGVLRNGQWEHFQMDLGNPKHREAFFDGQILSDAKLA